MNYINSKIKIVFKNSIMVQGILKEWTHKEIVLLDDNNLIILPNGTEDILFFKVLETQQTTEKLKKEQPIIKQENIIKINNDLKEIINKPDEDLINKAKTIAELKKELTFQEKEIIKNKLQNHIISPNQKAEYGYPNFFKKSSIK